MGHLAGTSRGHYRKETGMVTRQVTGWVTRCGTGEVTW